MTAPNTIPRLDLIPGTLCDARLWARLERELAGHASVHHIPLQQAGTRQQMRDMIAALSAPQAHLVGFSLGAYLALEHAVRHPERIASLTLIANSARGLAEEEIATRKRVIALLERNTYAGITRQRLRELLHPAHLEDAAITGLIRQMALDLGKDVLLAQFAQTFDRPDLMDCLPGLPFPVLIVGAEGDQLVASADLVAMAQQLPRATLHLLQAPSGHMIPLEAPAELACAMLAFLNPAPSGA
ncbi:alpha/beta fold hydrolase [Janthinobacterium psychrotolerans]|uniref:Pimeloyl-ACP methyl ester carboxylesterase n=1 Tax=Janthinobacterium psychrotolerans TaxID=1747903 RepID=A0A1A7BX34_9BURK|nr:alpha/beta fold hydrolase [Janthinobacterium psychrotolerans]OBV38161.1 Pimeloyl-ACP methyl ester carboxylesterase [Janthinobacterium psychrotolerans]